MYGHQAGDKALEVFGEVLRHELRGSDLAGRYGGDEFVMIFPHTAAKDACESLERIRAHVERIVLRSGTQSYTLTCTAGVAEFRPDMNNMEELVHNADTALYQGKSLGRNQVALFKEA
jgi:two-component system, cell cycle response regulator